MGTLRLTAIGIIVAGILALAYGGFSYTKENTAATIGPIKLKVEEKETVNVPMWAGVAAVIGGGLVLLLSARKP
jgi:hypothetical protein